MREEWTSDGDHPSVEGYRLLGFAFLDAFGSRLAEPGSAKG